MPEMNAFASNIIVVYFYFLPYSDIPIVDILISYIILYINIILHINIHLI